VDPVCALEAAKKPLRKSDICICDPQAARGCKNKHHVTESLREFVTRVPPFRLQAASEAAASAAKQAATEAIAEQREATRDAAEKTSTEQMAKTAAQQALAAQAAQSVVGGQVRSLKILLCLGGTYRAFLTCFWERRERQRYSVAAVGAQSRVVNLVEEIKGMMGIVDWFSRGNREEVPWNS
jgi:hypothetical protein